MTRPQLSIAFFLHIFVILAVLPNRRTLARRVTQPQVVGEMIAGLLLGRPSSASSSPVCKK